MVFFTCNHCGESVKKPSVEKHYDTKCRGAFKNVSCMDCLKDFRGEEYVAHIKCVTEAEKYSGKGYVAKESSNGKKQESWTNVIRSILQTGEYNLSADVRDAFQRLQNAENVPRKKAKFENFVANCNRMPRRLASEVWFVLEKELAKMKQAKQEEVAAAKVEQQKEKELKVQNGNKREVPAENGNAEPKKKKPKKDSNKETSQGDEFTWASILQGIVSERVDGIKIKTLKNKLLKLYLEYLTTTKLTEEQKKKFDEQFEEHLASAPLQETDGIVTLKSDNKELPKENGNVESSIKTSKKKKVTATTEEIVEPFDNNAEESTDNEFEWAAVLKKIVCNHQEGISMEKLKTKLRKKYTAKLGIDAEKKFEKEFIKHLKRCSAVRVEEIVKPCAEA